MPDLKLGKLPERTPVKLSINLMPDLAEALAAYAALYKQTYGREEALSDLIPAMLAAFLDSDKVFAKDRKQGAASPIVAGG